MGRVLVELPKVKPLRDRTAKALKEALGIELSDQLIEWDGWVLQVQGKRRILTKREAKRRVHS